MIYGHNAKSKKTTNCTRVGKEIQTCDFRFIRRYPNRLNYFLETRSIDMIYRHCSSRLSYLLETRSIDMIYGHSAKSKKPLVAEHSGML
jgi:hypothetical protein